MCISVVNLKKYADLNRVFPSFQVKMVDLRIIKMLTHVKAVLKEIQSTKQTSKWGLKSHVKKKAEKITIQTNITFKTYNAFSHQATFLSSLE